ncbi:hypothetical protein GQ600_11825 [Phytophthora cactorum]|nr:hypothetical protein GQ600_11825 [Phytophthora cactorum]
MLRRWSQRGLASATPAARRTFWNPLDILSRLKSGDEDTDKKAGPFRCRVSTFLGDARAGRVAHAKKAVLPPTADEGNEAAENKTNAACRRVRAAYCWDHLPYYVRRVDATGTNVIAANEAVVVALLVGNFYALDDHERTIKFFGGYTERSAVETGAGGPPEYPKFSPSLSGFVRATRLWAPARSAYLDLLLAKNDYHKIAQFAREDTCNLESACESVMTMTPLLIGCRKEKDSAWLD